MKHTLWPSSNQLYWVTTILHQNQREIKVAFCFLALVISQKKMWLCLTILRENKGTGARIQLDKTAEPVSPSRIPLVSGGLSSWKSCWIFLGQRLNPRTQHLMNQTYCGLLWTTLSFWNHIWDIFSETERDFREKLRLIKHLSSTAASVKLSRNVKHNSFFLLVPQKRPVIPPRPLKRSSGLPCPARCLLHCMRIRLKPLST